MNTGRSRSIEPRSAHDGAVQAWRRAGRLRAGRLRRDHRRAGAMAARQSRADPVERGDRDARRNRSPTMATFISCPRFPDFTRRIGAQTRAASSPALTATPPRAISRARRWRPPRIRRWMSSARWNKDSGIPMRSLARRWRNDREPDADAVSGGHAERAGVRPRVLETTALGAAYAAGLAVGYWDGLDDLRATGKRRNVDSGDGCGKARSAGRSWSKAVGRSMDWA